MRILLITHDDLARSHGRAESRFSQALLDLADVTIVEWSKLARPSVESAAEVAGATCSEFDVCVLFVRFKELEPSRPFVWSGFTGRRVWIEHDAWLSFSPAHSEYSRRFSQAYRAHGFELMITTGRYTANRLVEEGVNAVWIPKGYSDDVFSDLGLRRRGVCTFGTRWHSRRALVHHLRRRGIDIVDVSGPFETLNERLNGHSAAVVCNMPAIPPLGRIGRLIARRRPEFVRLHPAVEPMSKTFEVAAAGCAPVVDAIDELEALGFVDGLTCLTYRTFDEAVERLRHTSPAELRAVGAAAASLCLERHAWRHRAKEFLDVLGAAE